MGRWVGLSWVKRGKLRQDVPCALPLQAENVPSYVGVLSRNANPAATTLSFGCDVFSSTAPPPNQESRGKHLPGKQNELLQTWALGGVPGRVFSIVFRFYQKYYFQQPKNELLCPVLAMGVHGSEAGQCSAAPCLPSCSDNGCDKSLPVGFEFRDPSGDAEELSGLCQPWMEIWVSSPLL